MCVCVCVCVCVCMYVCVCVSPSKESACNVGDLGSIPGLGRSSAEENCYPLQYSVLENSMDCIVHGVTKSWTELSDFTHSLMIIYIFVCVCVCVLNNF